MSDSWEKNREGADVLPRPELNPLVNPVLEHNLGRWAEVYFTSPPEKREQAIIDLLMELQRTNEFEPDEPHRPVAPALPQELRPQESKPVNLMGIVCPGCQFENIAGQRFCGVCGAPLLTNGTPPTVEPQPSPVIVSAIPGPPHTALIDDSAATGNDVGWLREKAFSQWDEVEPPAHRGKMLFVAVLALTVLFGVVAYTYWPSRDRNIQSLSPKASVPPATAIQPPQPAPVESPAASAPENPPAPEKGPVDAPRYATTHTPLSPHRVASAAPAASPGDGTQELLLAEQSLDGKNGARDSAQAARLLWKAVGKQNAQASLLLSDLYARGDGVARNCDQARILLVAAARKGTPAATQQLHSLESSGCH